MKKVKTVHYVIAGLIGLIATHYLSKLFAIDRDLHPVLYEVVWIGGFAVFYIGIIAAFQVRMQKKD